VGFLDVRLWWLGRNRIGEGREVRAAFLGQVRPVGDCLLERGLAGRGGGLLIAPAYCPRIDFAFAIKSAGAA